MNNIPQLIDKWHVCPLSDNLQDLFRLTKDTIQHYVKQHEKLTPVAIIHIVKDLRHNMNPERNENLYYYTDIILDNILLQHKNISRKDLPDLFESLDCCLEMVYSSKL